MSEIYNMYVYMYYICVYVASLVAYLVKNPLAMQEIQVQSLSPEGTLEKGMTTYSSILAWKSPMDRGAGCSPWGHKSQM